MPALSIKQFQVISVAGDPSKAAVPANPGRKYLVIQNTGGNPGRVRLGGAVRGDGGDMVFSAGQLVPLSIQADLCPLESINFQSTAGTTWAVLEGV